MTDVRPLTKWVYVGGEEGYGLVHTVGHIEDDVINTWSEPDQGLEEQEGFLWRGSLSQFRWEFKPLGFAEGSGV